MKVPEEFAGTTGLIPGPDVGLRSDTSLKSRGIYYAKYYGTCDGFNSKNNITYVKSIAIILSV